MILHALAEYYERKRVDDPASLALEGFERKEIPYLIVLDSEGRVVGIENTQTGEGKKRVPRKFTVPQGVKKTSGIAANLMWDTAEYALGLVPENPKNDPKKVRKPERIAEQHQAFVKRVWDELAHVEDRGIQALRNFLENKDFSQVEGHPDWQAIREDNPVVSFKLQGEKGPIVESKTVVSVFQNQKGAAGMDTALCLVSGETQPIERLHTAIKGVWGAQTSGANIVSFNLKAFTSFGKEQGANSPVGSPTVFKYTTALNHLLRKGSEQRMQVGDASTVFWAENDCGLEQSLAVLLGEPEKDNPDLRTNAIRSLFASINSGNYTEPDAKYRFYILGLAPNAARISVRFWRICTVAELAVNIAQYFEDLEITEPDYKKVPKVGYPSLFRLLTAIAVQGKADNVPPNLAGDTMQAILDGQPLPYTLLQAAVRRCRAEREVGYVRAALLKAILNRRLRNTNPSQTHFFTVALDPNNPNIGYRLGRLFAVLEKIQQDANPGINATIRDRYYGAASSTPSTVFAQLMRLKNHHLSKLGAGQRISHEKRLTEVVGGMPAGGFPRQLSLPDQGAFAIGYYHQMQDFYTRKEDKTTPTETQE